MKESWWPAKDLSGVLYLRHDTIKDVTLSPEGHQETVSDCEVRECSDILPRPVGMVGTAICVLRTRTG